MFLAKDQNDDNVSNQMESACLDNNVVGLVIILLKYFLKLGELCSIGHAHVKSPHLTLWSGLAGLTFISRARLAPVMSGLAGICRDVHGYICAI